MGELIPDNDHGDAAGQADEDQADHVLGLVGEQDDGEQEHECRADDPVLDEREPEHFPVAEYPPHFLVSDLGQRRIHHQDQTRGDRDVGGARREPVPEVGDAGLQPSPTDPDSHGEEDPHCEITVE